MQDNYQLSTSIILNFTINASNRKQAVVRLENYGPVELLYYTLLCAYENTFHHNHLISHHMQFCMNLERVWLFVIRYLQRINASIL